MADAPWSTPAAFPATRREALARLEGFVPAAGEYAARRNHVGPGHSHVSRLSPAVRHRLVLEEEIIERVLARWSWSRVEKFTQEVLWRTYWKGWLELRPQVWRQYLEALRRWHRHGAPDALARAREVAEGRSGVAIMDRFAHELRTTGYLHNHARMWWASFWIHREGLPWELGADFFFRHLLDADAASNTLSWRWVAGLQTSGKTYLVRTSNLERYCDPEWLADRTGWERLEESVAPTPEAGPRPVPTELPPLPDRPSCTGRWGVWVHADDTSVEVGALARERPAAVAAFTSQEIYAQFGLSPLRRAYLHQVLADGVARAAAAFGVPATFEDRTDLGNALVEWARKQRLDHLVAYRPFVGPVADALPAIGDALRQAGTQLHLLRRPWDARWHPRARSGFFGFWESVQGELRSGASQGVESTPLLAGIS